MIAKSNKLDLIVPTIPKDLNILLGNINMYFEKLPINRIIIIGNEEVLKLLPKDERIPFINEELLINFDLLKRIIINRTGSEEAGRRTGWYVQQFIKMAYSRICDNEYYLLWDSDTIPLKRIEFYGTEHPYIDCKTEYHEPYFITIEKLFPGMKKCIDGSFISEHMLINAPIMREMIDNIESNDELKGKSFEEKILNAIPIEFLANSGFSEFETYGTYVSIKYPKLYCLRKWKSMRYGGFFFNGINNMTENNVKWLSKSYDAVSFEKGDNISLISTFVQSKHFEKIFNPSVLEVLAFAIRAVRKITGKR